jgi:UDP-N-acetylmuramate dehydrogenase
LSTKIEKYKSDIDNIEFREKKQPKWNTCGSFFKNPNREQSAWFLIESVWLKWKKINWAYFSDLHANFLMSDWTASYKDLLYLINLAQEKVKEKFWVDIENEVRIIKN